jgi:hypothetical protein
MTRAAIATEILAEMVNREGPPEDKVRAAVLYADLLLAELAATDPATSAEAIRRKKLADTP